MEAEEEDIDASKEDKKLDNGPVSAKAAVDEETSDDATSTDTDETAVVDSGDQALASKVAKIVASVKVEEQLIPNSMSPAQDSLIQKISAAFNKQSVRFTR